MRLFHILAFTLFIPMLAQSGVGGAVGPAHHKINDSKETNAVVGPYEYTDSPEGRALKAYHDSILEGLGGTRLKIPEAGMMINPDGDPGGWNPPEVTGVRASAIWSVAGVEMPLVSEYPASEFFSYMAVFRHLQYSLQAQTLLYIRFDDIGGRGTPIAVCGFGGVPTLAATQISRNSRGQIIGVGRIYAIALYAFNPGMFVDYNTTQLGRSFNAMVIFRY